ncbi:hypothetical protein [Pedobacter sp. MR22-3]|uniref:hypothetical protein n=1 Tax=Pedobacter sp. MR22-3 TaxID=2994552 RepID=UPI00224744FE|nr:hypothetical protein [Pedobacter sp. MR22-3]
MMSSSPQTAQSTRPYKTLYKSKNVPLLTIVDNKISGSLSCKSPAKFWGGLAALAVGIAIGAACVLSGGLLVAVIIAASVVAVSSGVMMGIKIAHDCDSTLDVFWQKPHTTVRIQSKLAILNRSYLNCPKGGVLNLIIDPVIAKEAAKQISSNNRKEVAIQAGSQLVMGVISGLTMSGIGVLGAVTTAVLTPLGYWSGEDKLIAKSIMSDDVADTPFVGGTVEATASTVAGTAAPGALIMGTGYVAYGAGVLVKSPGTQLLGGVATAIGKSRIMSDFKPSSMKNGLIGAAANLVIGETTDMLEKSYEDTTTLASRELNKLDGKNNISIISNK